MEDDLIYWLWLSTLNNIGPVSQNFLLNYFGTPYNVYKASKDELITIKGIGNNKADDIYNNKSLKNAELIIKSAKRSNIGIFTMKDSRYPVEYTKIKKMPIVLYYRGEIKNLNNGTGIIGTRKCNQYGKKVTEDIAGYLADNNVTVISGMSKGIEGYAHIATVNAGGYTVAFLGSGVEFYYPKENYKLYKKIIETGAVVSEYPPGVKVYPSYLIIRNYLMMGFSRKVLLVQSPMNSASIKSAEIAKEMGKEIYIVPNNIYAKESEGSNFLISQGFEILLNREQLLGLEKNDALNKSQCFYKESIQYKIIELLRQNHLSIDQLKMHFPDQSIASQIFELEMRKVITNIGGKMRLK